LKRKTHNAGFKTGELSFTRNEIDKLVSCCNSLEDEIFIKLEIAVGLRRDDCAKIKIKNVDLVDETLTFYEQKKNLTRSVPLPPPLIRLLKQYIQTLPKSQEYLFKCGKSRYGGKTLYNKLQKLCQLSGVRERPVHALRGSSAKLHLQEGWQISEVASLLGDLPSTIEKYYSCPSTSEIKELMKKSGVV